MRIELESPFKERWAVGYLIVCPDNRRRVFLYNSQKDRAGLSYARYLMSVHLGRLLRKDEHVDHKDEDKTNDSLDNLQILTRAENIAKNQKYRLKARGLESFLLIMTCSVCDKDFSRNSLVVQRALASNPNRTITCSKSCSAKLQLKNGKSTLGGKKTIVTNEQHALIIELRAEGKSDYVISDMIGLSRAKIQRYRVDMEIP